MSARTFRPLGLFLLVAALVAVGGPALADDSAQHIVLGTFEQLTEDAVLGSDTGATDVSSVVEVDGRLYPLPDEVTPPDATTGQQVQVTVQASSDMTAEQALEATTTGSAQVVDVEVVAQDQVAAATVLGAHTLTVLPIYWSGHEADTSVSVLSALASSTATYWADQSDDAIAITTSVADWAEVDAPTSCDYSTLWNEALAANPTVQASSGHHVLVYFPYTASCGWAGLATVTGSRIWVNGYPELDVVAHEFGHNLGLGHANTVNCGTSVLLVPWTSCSWTEYADYADLMGGASGSTTIQTGNLTTGLAASLGLVQSVQISSSTLTTVTLSRLASVGSLRAIVVPVSGGSVYVDYRPSVGRDRRIAQLVSAGLLSSVDWAGVQAHLVVQSSGVPVAYLLDERPTTSTAFTRPDMAIGQPWQVTGTAVWLTVLEEASDSSSAVVLVAQNESRSLAGRYVWHVYEDLFGRSVDSSGLATWVGLLSAGTARSAVATSITSSDEYRSGLITTSYATYLDRSPDAAGLAFWLSLMQAGLTIDKLEGGILASDESYAVAGGTAAGWVRSLYQQVLGRSAASSEVAFWTARMAAGSSRAEVASGFLLSTEHLTSIVDGYYVSLLGRHIDSAGQATWVSQLQSGVRLENVVGDIIASEEYYGLTS